MKSPRQLIVIAILATFFVAPGSLLGQSGVSSLSMGMTRAGIAPQFGEIRIEEFINYHRHLLPLPQGEDRVRLDLQWGLLDSGRAVVQVGLATPRAIDRETMPPLNLVLVIDRSGSMSGDRIENVKKSLLSFVEQLRSTDNVTIVGFSNNATVELPACSKTSQKEIIAAIDRIQAGGSTNLHAGLMLGYDQARKNFDPERSNRVILLSDGIANRGVTDSAVIARESKAFNKLGIDLSTIGLGNDFNQELLRELADAGRGQIHFVSDAKDIEKTFVDELDGLLAPAARKVRLKIGWENSKPEKIYGYDPQSKDDSISFRLDDLNHGATQVVISEWALKEKTAEIRATLSYVDAVTGEDRELVESITLERASLSRVSLAETDLNKNHTIAVLASSISEAARLTEREHFSAAESELVRSLRFARKSGIDRDADMRRMIELVKKYRDSIRTYVTADSGQDR